MSQRADDIIKRADVLSSNRSGWESAWQDCIDLALPMHEATNQGFGHRAAQLISGPNSDARGRKVYDSVGAVAVDRLSSGIEALVSPQSEKWHGLKPDDPFHGEVADVEEEWFDALTEYLFGVRYDSRSGFVSAHQKGLRSTVALGTGVAFIEENMGASAARVPFFYQHVPLNECLIAVDKRNEPDTLFRRYSRTARQYLQQFRERTPAKIKVCAENAQDMDKPFELIHAVLPRESYDGDLPQGSTRNATTRSCFVDMETRAIIGEGGYFEFPFAIYYWHHGSQGYAESPLMFALAELKSLQMMNKTGLRMMGQLGDPPLAVAHDGVTNRPNLNPRAVNPNAIDDQGRLRIQPIITPQMPQLFWEVMAGKRSIINEYLYLHLFRSIAQRTSQITATEALILANEKGELLGPAGSKIQSTLAQMSERELGILGRKGIYDPGHALSPPRSLSGQSFGVKFTGPLDRIRRSKELLGAQNTVGRAMQLAQLDPSAMDNIDSDAYIELSQEIEGAPRKLLRTKDERDELRAARQAQQQPAADAAGATATAEAIQGGAEAVDMAAMVAQKHGPAVKAAMEGM